MLRILITLLPCFLYLNWIPYLLIKKDKTGPQRILTAVAILGTITFYADAVSLIPQINYREMALMNVFLQASIFMMFPAFLLYIRAVGNRKTHPAVKAFMFLPPALMFGATVWVWAKIGLDGMADYLKAYDAVRSVPSGFSARPYAVFQLVSKDIHGILIGVWTIVEWAILLHTLIDNGSRLKKVKRFIEGKASGTQLSVMCILAIIFFLGGIVRMILGRYFLMDHPTILCILYLFIALSETSALYIGYWYDGKGIMLPTARKDEEEKKHERLAEKLKVYMETERAYLRPDLSLEEAASDLSTNRTYLSEAVKLLSGSNFREYVNRLRIEAAKAEIKDHPGDRIEAIAARTGFSSSSQLVKKFKEMTGESPRKWARKQ